MVGMAISGMGVSTAYVHRATQAADQTIYLKERINQQLLPFFTHVIIMEIFYSGLI